MTELLSETEEDYLNRIPMPRNPDPADADALLAETTAFFDYVKQNENVFRVLFGESAGRWFSSRLVRLLCSEQVYGKTASDPRPDHFTRLYIANGTVGMMREWVSEGFLIDSRQIAEMMYHLSRKVIS